MTVLKKCLVELLLYIWYSIQKVLKVSSVYTYIYIYIYIYMYIYIYIYMVYIYIYICIYIVYIYVYVYIYIYFGFSSLVLPHNNEHWVISWSIIGHSS